MDLSLFFAGTAGSVPTPARGLPALLLRAGGERILFDCGEGTQHQLLRSIGLPDLDAIFITHLHLDHWLGLPGMLKTFDMRDRERPLDALRPARAEARCSSTLRPVDRAARDTRSRSIELEPHEEVGFGDFVIAAFPVNHRVEAFGYAFIEDDRPGRFDVEAARALGVTEGPDFGRLQRGETVNGVTPEQVVGEDRAGPPDRLLRRHRAGPDRRDLRAGRRRARPRGDLLRGRARPRPRDRPLHRPPGGADSRSTPSVKLLALTHLSTRYFPREIRDEARATCSRTRSSRATSTRSRSRSPSAASPQLVKAELEPAA